MDAGRPFDDCIRADFHVVVNLGPRVDRRGWVSFHGSSPGSNLWSGKSGGVSQYIHTWPTRAVLGKCVASCQKLSIVWASRCSLIAPASYVAVTLGLGTNPAF